MRIEGWMITPDTSAYTCSKLRKRVLAAPHRDHLGPVVTPLIGAPRHGQAECVIQAVAKLAPAQRRVNSILTHLHLARWSCLESPPRAVSACWNVSHHQSRLPDGLQPVLIAQIAGCVQRALIVGDGHLEPAGLLLQTLQVRLRLLKDQQEPLVVDLMLLLGWLKAAPVPMQRLATRMLCQRLKAGCQLLASRRHTVQRGPG